MEETQRTYEARNFYHLAKALERQGYNLERSVKEEPKAVGWEIYKTGEHASERSLGTIQHFPKKSTVSVNMHSSKTSF